MDNFAPEVIALKMLEGAVLMKCPPALNSISRILIVVLESEISNSTINKGERQEKNLLVL